MKMPQTIEDGRSRPKRLVHLFLFFIAVSIAVRGGSIRWLKHLRRRYSFSAPPVG
jgi:hypothetical protein